MLKPIHCVFLRALTILIAISVTGCEKKPIEPIDPSGATRHLIQGMQVAFYQVEQGDEHWFEVAIAVDSSRSFRMPVFFTERGELAEISPENAKRRIDAWLKQRAISVATLGSVGLQAGQTPFITISENPAGR